jgi:serine-type D-Ala-D-Ala endopeptidase (penicillin-binding protein 7)
MFLMTQLHPAGAFARRSAVPSFALLLCGALLTFSAASASAATSKKVDKKSTKSCGKSSGKKSCAKNDKAGKSDKKNGKANGKTTGKKNGKKGARASQPPRHHHSEKHVVAMKGNQPNVQSLGCLIMDLDTGQELFARKPDLPRAIASISKLAATLTVMDKELDLDGLTTIKKVDVDVARGGAKSRLLEGMTLSNRDLLHAALLGSDNRAVSALGRAVGLGTAQFTVAMNRKVASMGLRYTRFREPTGLSSDNQSTPRETIEMLKTAMAHPVLGPIVRRSEYDAHPVSRPPIHYVNTHKPAARANVQVLGGKTGYNDSARYCLVIAARIGEHNYGMSFLATEGDLTRFGDVARVADWIITHKPKRSPSTAPQGPPPPEAILGPIGPDGGGPSEGM